MPELVKNGKKQFFPQSKVQEAVRDGWRFDSSKPVDLVIEGSLRQVDADSAYSLLGVPGVTESTSPLQAAATQEKAFQEEFGGVGAQLQGGIERFGATASLGLTDIANRALGQSATELQKRGEGTAGTIGSIAGIAPALLTGVGAARAIPAGGAALLGQGVARSIGGVGGAVAGGLTEGALFGAGQGISNLALSNKPLTAESVFSEIGFNALVGGGLGASVGAVVGGLSKAGKIAESRRAAEKAAEEASERSLTAQQSFATARSDFKRGINQLNDLTSTAVAAGSKSRAFSPASFGAKYDNLLSAERTIAETMEDIVANGPRGNFSLKKSYQNVAKESLGELEKAQKIRKQIEELAGTQDLGKVSHKAILDSGESLKKLTAKYEKALEDSVAGIRKFEQDIAKKYPATLRGKSFVPTSALDSINVARGINLVKDSALDQGQLNALSILKSDLKTLSSDIDKLGPEELLKAAKGIEDYRAQLKTLDESLGGQFSQRVDELVEDVTQKINRALPDIAGEYGVLTGQGSDTLQILAMAAGMDLEGDLLESVPVIGPVADAFLKFWLASKVLGVGGTQAAAKLGKNAKDPTLQKANKILRDIAYRAGGRLGSGLGRKQQMVSSGAGDAVGYALGSHAAVNVVDSVAGASRGMSNITDNASKRIRDIASKIREPVERGTKAAIPTGAVVFARITGDSSDKDEAAQLQKTIRALQFDSTQLNLEAVAQGNVEVAENLRAHIEAVRNYLLERLPKDPRTNPGLLGYKWTPSKSELLGASRLVNAATNPGEVLDRVNNGVIHGEEAEAVRALYPNKVALLEEAVLDNMTAVLAAPRQKQINLSILLGKPIGYDSHVISTLQQNYAEQTAQEEQQKQQSQPRQYNRENEPTEKERLLAQ